MTVNRTKLNSAANLSAKAGPPHPTAMDVKSSPGSDSCVAEGAPMCRPSSRAAHVKAAPNLPCQQAKNGDYRTFTCNNEMQCAFSVTRAGYLRAVRVDAGRPRMFGLPSCEDRTDFIEVHCATRIMCPRASPGLASKISIRYTGEARQSFRWSRVILS
jgi:hypothetical protein